MFRLRAYCIERVCVERECVLAAVGMRTREWRRGCPRRRSRGETVARSLSGRDGRDRPAAAPRPAGARRRRRSGCR
ncbi:hypothetical protein FE772_23560 [Lysobacter enzymogenes]|nr:hypothetical protein FE772_23560 [Lysobacter enzymogenes]